MWLNPVQHLTLFGCYGMQYSAITYLDETESSPTLVHMDSQLNQVHTFKQSTVYFVY